MRLCVPCEQVQVDILPTTPVRIVIRRLVAAYGKTAYRINDGHCDWFAEDLVFLLEWQNKRPLYWDTEDPDEIGLPGHCWVILEGRCYDAETPRGVPNWEKLPIFVKFLKAREGRASATA